MKDTEKELVLTGIVSPAGWDAAGRVSAACIAADDGTPFFVTMGSESSCLLEYLGKYVCVRGRVIKKGNRRYVFPDSVCDAPHPDF